jgi:transposase-like protein
LTEREISRNAARRLAIIRHAQEVSGNVAFTCRYYGVARPSYYKWLRRYEELGVDGLRDRSRRPLVCPPAAAAPGARNQTAHGTGSTRPTHRLVRVRRL